MPPTPSHATRRLLASSLALAAATARGVGTALAVGSSRNAWRELAAKLDAFRWYQEGRSGVPPEARGAGIFTRMWRTEGVAYRRAERWRPTERPRPTGEGRAPLGDLVPLHAGTSVALAIRGLATAPPGRPELLGPALDGFLLAARKAAEPGWEDVVVEGLGLVAWTLHRRRLREIEEALARRRTGVRELFWHGVGRGLYFAPSQVLRVRTATRRAVELARSAPADETGRMGALAGIAWALTLVNLRSPEVVAEALALAGGELVPGGPVEQGICAALLVWTATAGWDATVDRFVGRAARAAAHGEPWRRLLERCATALDTLPPLLTDTGRWPDLFRFRPLDALEAELRQAIPQEVS